MDRFINNLRVLWRTERAIADIKLRHALARSGLNVAAAVLALIGLLMFEVAVFYALRDVWSTIVAALILGVVNLLLAGILLLIADRRKPGRELDLANEIHKNTMDALQADARLLQADFASFGQTLKHPVDSLLPLIVPLATIVINAIKKKTEAK
jgi:type VI protein secretion system component VasK